ncbi:AraC family transcriptional regulator [Lentilactobacillus curieae]|uniref:AraC family transcriptional regulator n=1 Tax=Lentilactobacillus curieae TaxID=1138822 RepID=A0A1S6QGM1_9LACO|nr:helix-turn-helix domain-containing protein [Lentilactobacillus curieae]AQW20752.1 AraC family transcriptional regulator [Lentilactobacillus curieae]
MESNQVLSISCVPMPVFIEGGIAHFIKGDNHPDGDDLPYFVMILLEKGHLYLSEDDNDYIIEPGQMFILQPMHHHYSWKPVEEETDYYWLHFYVSGNWKQSDHPVRQPSKIEVPNLHYSPPDLTLYLNKQQDLSELSGLTDKIDVIFESSFENAELGFWRSQQQFINVLQYLQSNVEVATSSQRLASQVIKYLKNNYADEINNELLSKQFHTHESYIIRSVKNTYGITPNKYLTRVRIDEAKNLLLNSDKSVSEISEEVGFQNVYYFSTVFKKQEKITNRIS